MRYSIINILVFFTHIPSSKSWVIILPIKTTAAQNEVALSYHRVRGLYFQAVFFVVTIVRTRIRVAPSLFCDSTRDCIP